MTDSTAFPAQVTDAQINAALSASARVRLGAGDDRAQMEAALIAALTTPPAGEKGSEYDCETCRDDPMECAKVPGLHLCGKANE